jgi:integrase/recombinase XerD
MTITPYRRHSASCPHKSKRGYKGCRCPMWLELWDKGKSMRKSARTRSWEQGQKIARAEEQRYEQAALGEKPKPVAVTVEEAATSFVDTKKGEGLDKDTLQKHRRMTALLLDYCHRKNLLFIRELTLPHLTAHRAEWDKNLKSKLSRRNNQGRLKEFFRYCRKSRWIDENPAEDLGTIKIKKNEQIRTDPFEPEEMQRIFAAIEPALETEYTRRRVRALILAQRHAGLSIEDGIILLRTGVVEEKNNYRVITDRKKTGAHIDNVIPAWVGLELLAAPNSNPKYLLWSGEGDSESTVKYFQRLLKKVFKIAGVPDGHSHRFRDTAAVELLLKGVGIEEVAQFLGDTVPVAARYYAKWNQRRQKKLDDALRAAFEPERRAIETYSVQ